MMTSASWTPVVFVHGLWLHASSWGPWLELFGRGGYGPAAPGCHSDAQGPGKPAWLPGGQADGTRSAGDTSQDREHSWGQSARCWRSSRPSVKAPHGFRVEMLAT